MVIDSRPSVCIMGSDVSLSPFNTLWMTRELCKESGQSDARVIAKDRGSHIIFDVIILQSTRFI